VLTVGAGASPLVGVLLRTGHHVIAVDIAQAALDALVAELDETTTALAATHLALVVADVRSLRVGEQVDVWHDRAVFHFLVDPADRTAYARSAAAAVASGGHLVIATFAPNGPTSCSGLPVTRHDAASLAAVLAPHFELVESFDADHHTPWDAVQHFTHALFRRI
jgi:SAM-dependent methyltransferase